MKLPVFYISPLLVLVLLTRQCLGVNPLVRLKQGDLQGTISPGTGGRVAAFQGIPYAIPPVGTRRFRAPLPHPGWNGTLRATSYGLSCPQPFIQSHLTSEDCLTLNVWAPSAVPESTQLGVLVILEGELWVTSQPQRFSGAEIASRGLIVVTLNYRTNIFGFLHWPRANIDGNIGLRDQNLALRWVADNIARFNGDARRVALLGHSAGGASASMHLTATPSQGLFSRLILLSGSSTAGWAVMRRPEVATQRLVGQLGCNSARYSTQQMYDCVQRMPTQKIMRVVTNMIEGSNPDHMFGPVIESWGPERNRMVPEDPLTALKKMRALNIPILASITELDGSVMLYLKQELNYMARRELSKYSREVLVPMALAMAGFNSSSPSSELLQTMVQFEYLDNSLKNDTDDLRYNIVKMFSDSLFKSPMIQFVEASSSVSLPTYLLVNDAIAPNIYGLPVQLEGSTHGTDLMLLSGSNSFHQLTRGEMNVSQKRFSEVLQFLLVNFVNRGRPTLGTYRSTWLPYTSESGTFAQFQTGKLTRADQDKNMRLWLSLLPKMENIHLQISNKLETTYVKNNPPFTTKATTTTTTTTSTSSPTSVSTAKVNATTPWTLITQKTVSGAQVEENSAYQIAVWGLLSVIAIFLLSVALFALWNRRNESKLRKNISRKRMRLGNPS